MMGTVLLLPAASGVEKSSKKKKFEKFGELGFTS